LARASGQLVGNAFGRLKEQVFSKGTWLEATNHYVEDVIEQLAHDANTGRITNHSDLIDYIAVSSPIHCVDGWSYLGRALESHMRGDCNTATHLAYYAELRAAMSLLASQGVGIFRRHHIVVTGPQTCEYLNRKKNNGKLSPYPTHDIAWVALKEWASLSGDALAKVLKINDASLEEWLVSFSRANPRLSPNVLPTILELLESWGLDLSRLSEDKEERDKASYRPNCIDYSISSNVFHSSTFICNLWKNYQPSGASSFDFIDKYLLRLSLEKSFESAFGKLYDAPKPNLQRIALFKSFIESTLRDLGFEGFTSTNLLKFLTREIESREPSIILHAREKDTAKTSENHHLQVISRSALLLRLATALCLQQMKLADVTLQGDLDFWWRPIAENRGLWDIPSDIDIQDLWEDIEDVLDRLSDWEAKNLNTSVSPGKWRQECSYSLSRLGGCELIALWGLGLQLES
jgi:hypothetical protein